MEKNRLKMASEALPRPTETQKTPSEIEEAKPGRLDRLEELAQENRQILVQLAANQGILRAALTTPRGERKALLATAAEKEEAAKYEYFSSAPPLLQAILLSSLIAILFLMIAAFLFDLSFFQEEYAYPYPTALGVLPILAGATALVTGIIERCYPVKRVLKPEYRDRS